MNHVISSLLVLCILSVFSMGGYRCCYFYNASVFFFWLKILCIQKDDNCSLVFCGSDLIRSHGKDDNRLTNVASDPFDG